MKTFISLSLILFCCSINTYADEFKFIAGDTKSTTKICIDAVTDKPEILANRLRKISRRGTALNLRTFINSLKCNNQYIGHFAKTYNAQKTFAYLDQFTNRMNKKHQANIIVKNLAKEQGINKAKTIVVLVSSN